MKVTREKTENSQAFLTIEMEPAEVEKSLAESYHRLVKKANIPGFRKGKAPRDILERYIGKESLLEDALNTLVPQACEDAIQEQEIEAIAQPQVEVTQVEPVTFTAVVPLKPTVKLIIDDQGENVPGETIITLENHPLLYVTAAVDREDLPSEQVV